MPTYPAEIPELVRSNRKDEEHLSTLRNYIFKLLGLVGGPACLISWHQSASLLAEAVYFVLTTLSGFQTLGEEYLNLVQADKSGTCVPSLPQRISFIVFQIYTPFLLRLLHKKLIHPHSLSQGSSSVIQNIVNFLVLHQKNIEKVHLVAFYLFGTYYHIGKRLSGVKYLSLRPLKDGGIVKLFRWLGYITLLQLTLSGILFLYKSSITQQASSVNALEGAVNTGSSAYSCPICVSATSEPACTPCGHILCWNCAVEVSNRGEPCPICRCPYIPSRIISIRNL